MKKNLEILQNYILTLESIFFNPTDVPVNFRRLNPDSPTYDREYEQRVRRQIFKNAYILDDMLEEHEVNTQGTNKLLWEIEDLIFSPDFLHNLIFSGTCCCFKSLFVSYCQALEQQIQIFDKLISDQKYKLFIRKSGCLNAPQEKENFLKELHVLMEFVDSKRALIEAVTINQACSNKMSDQKSVA